MNSPDSTVKEASLTTRRPPNATETSDAVIAGLATANTRQRGAECAEDDECKDDAHGPPGPHRQSGEACGRCGGFEGEGTGGIGSLGRGGVGADGEVEDGIGSKLLARGGGRGEAQADLVGAGLDRKSVV